MKDNITLYKHFGDAFARYYAKEETILDLFKELKLTDEQLVTIAENDRIDDNRCFVILKTKNRITGDLSKVIIDVTRGNPTWRQMMDVTFDRGRECDKKIVIYYDLPDMQHKSCSLDRRSFDNRDMAESFAAINNDCGIETYVGRYEVIIDADEDAAKEHTTWIGPGDTERTKYTEHPSKEEFQKAELWLYYWRFLGIDSPTEFEPDRWIPAGSYYRIGATIRPEWNQKGRFMIISANSDDEKAVLKWLLENRDREIREEFKDCEINVDNEPGILPCITIKMHDKPFEAFVNDTTDGKYFNVAQLRREELRVVDFFDGLIRDINRERKFLST